ncbi:MAG: TetR/AcrR family transcriptional regulator [Lachnospiraceae bacterium]|nr:TetR/AcrR family transcriptional regulator [Lachnospiraceae bacterium]
MARKESITKNMLLDAAFQLVKDEGIESLTARKLAAQAGCSTQPIFRTYKNMDEVAEEVFVKALEFYNEYYKNYKKGGGVPFVDLGMAYIAFAQKEKNLFKLLFVSEKRFGHSLYEILNGELQFVGHEINKAKNMGCKNPSGLFMQMWIFIHGAACMSLTGDYDLGEDETKKLLSDSYKSFV